MDALFNTIIFHEGNHCNWYYQGHCPIEGELYLRNKETKQLMVIRESELPGRVDDDHRTWLELLFDTAVQRIEGLKPSMH